MTDSLKLRWGILGPGNIARAFAGGLAHSRTGTLVAIGARDPSSQDYAAQFPGAKVHSGYRELLADPEVDAVYIATPHPHHVKWAITAARAGKHVLVEKPIGMNRFEAEAIFEAARSAGTFMGEAFMYRLHPMTERICALITEGVIGDVRIIRSSFGYAMPSFDQGHRIYAQALGGGGILDVGCYPVSMARLIAGTIHGAPFAEPVEIRGAAYLGPSGVDEWASALLSFRDGLIAEVSCSVSVEQDNMLRVFGTKGRLEVKDFWFATGHEGGQSDILIVGNDGNEEHITVREDRWLYSFEADGVADAVTLGRQEFVAPGMTWADTLGNMDVLDRWRADIGLSYPVERDNAAWLEQ